MFRTLVERRDENLRLDKRRTPWQAGQSQFDVTAAPGAPKVPPRSAAARFFVRSIPQTGAEPIRTTKLRKLNRLRQAETLPPGELPAASSAYEQALRLPFRLRFL